MRLLDIIMPYVKNTSYRDMPFTSETPRGSFCTFATVPDLALKSELHKDAVVNCRTVGILHSTEGRFYLTDVDTPSINVEKPMIRISLVYLKSPLQSTVMSYPVQIFGTLQWKNRPVIFATVIQTLSTSIVERVRSTLVAVTSSHLATSADMHTSDLYEGNGDDGDPT